MKQYSQLQIGSKKYPHFIYFGQPETKQEIESTFRLRFDSYSARGYIDSALFPDSLEKDNYDTEGKCQYFMASLDGKKTIGTVRLIKDSMLPTENDFSFDEPKEIRAIPRDKRGELGRLIIIPPDKERGFYLPRGLAMIFMLDMLVQYGINNGIAGGYVFVKTKLQKKLTKLKAPLHYIGHFKQTYPKEGVLFKYFSQPEDQVIPAYFITKEFKNFTRRIIHSTIMFEDLGKENYVLKTNLYTKFLQSLGII